MKITTTTIETIIEANAQELAESRTLGESFTRLLSRCLNGMPASSYTDEDEEDPEDEE